jgi:hypothetical protein
MEKFSACVRLMAHCSNILNYLGFFGTLNHAHKTKPSGMGESEIS